MGKLLKDSPLYKATPNRSSRKLSTLIAVIKSKEIIRIYDIAREKIKWSISDAERNDVGKYISAKFPTFRWKMVPEMDVLIRGGGVENGDFSFLLSSSRERLHRRA